MLSSTRTVTLSKSVKASPYSVKASSVSPLTTTSEPAGAAISTAPRSTLPAAPTPNPVQPNPGLGDTYKFYSGDGSEAQGWPAQDSWVDFNTMWTANKALIAKSCSEQSTWDNPANPSEAEIAHIHDAIVTTSQEAKVDARFILAIIMQESKGCVRVPITNYGHDNPGLMQDFEGTVACNTRKLLNGALSKEGIVQHPCPRKSIQRMIRQGTIGKDVDGMSLFLA